MTVTKMLRVLLVLLAVSVLLSGCVLGTLDELYCLPKRSEEYENLQAVVDKAMSGLEYCAPTYGENRQFMQVADLDGDGIDEYLVFARDDSDKPLKILIFCQLASGYVLMDTIEGYGFGYDFVSYAQMDDKPGLEIIVGRQVSEQVMRSVSVYRFTSGFSRQLLSTGYSQITTLDLDDDGISEMFLLSPGASEKSHGTAHLYSFYDGELQRSQEILLSASMTGFKMLVPGKLKDGKNVIYVTCASTDQSLVTDIFAMENKQLATFASAIFSDTIHNFYVYPQDIDADGVLELPRILPLDKVTSDQRQEYMVQWYALNSDHKTIVKRNTYHNFLDNWYLDLKDFDLEQLSVIQSETDCAFYYDGEKLFSIMVLTDADREEQAKQPGRIILYRGETSLYVAALEDYAVELNMEWTLKNQFHPIRVDVNTERD